jgi:hypothetical protein
VSNRRIDLAVDAEAGEIKTPPVSAEARSVRSVLSVAGVDATRRAISGPEVSALPPHIGGVDQFVDSTDILGAADRARAATVVLHASSPH